RACRWRQVRRDGHAVRPEPRRGRDVRRWGWRSSSRVPWARARLLTSRARRTHWPLVWCAHLTRLGLSHLICLAFALGHVGGFLGRRGAAQRGVAEGEAAETGDGVAVFEGIGQECVVAQRREQTHRFRLDE